MRVAFVGQQRAGKDTAASIFCEWAETTHYGEVLQYALADPIKELSERAYGTVTRASCQKIGAAIRAIDSEFWVKILKQEIIEDNPKFAVVSDVRYPNECAVLSGLGFSIIGVAAPDEERYLRSGTTPTEWAEAEKHESERAARAILLDAPHVVKNDGDVSEFRRRLRALFAGLVK